MKENSVCSTEFQVVLPIDSRYLYFLYGLFTFNPNYDEIAKGVGGTSGSHQRIDPKTIFNFPCPLVNLEYVHRFNLNVEQLFKKQIANQLQIRTLTMFRDILLQALLNGDVNIN